MSFEGFQPAGLDLLIQNRLMNSKDFYEAHKQAIRESVIEPFYELCEAMKPSMLKIDPLFVTIPSRMVSRVRRDTRYTKDKTLYRANMWLFFRRSKQTYESVPAYYMELGPDYWCYGCYGGAGQGEMATAREMILKNDALFLKAFSAVQSQDAFVLRGDCLKRPKYPDAPAEYQDWLNRKELIVEFREETDYSAVFDGTFVEPMLRAFERLKPFYDWMQTVHERTKLHRNGAQP